MKKQVLTTLLLTGGLCAASITAALAQTPAYIVWPLAKSNADSAAVRSTGITPGTTTFKHYVVSSGLPVTVSTGTTMAYPAYSKQYGQAFGWNASGGGWSSNATPPGPGSTVRRGNYEEFSFTASAPVQVDSLLFTTSVLSSSGGFLALTYSRSGFTTDSAEFTGGKGPNGVLASTTNGTFTAAGAMPSNSAASNRLPLPQYDAAASNATRTFRMAFNGATGLELATGNKLTFRLHYAVNSSSDGRYVLLRDVTVKSKQAATPLAARAVATTSLGVYPNPAEGQLTVPHAAASREAQVLVFNTIGTRIFAQAAQPGSIETTVNLDALAKGLYLVEYADGGQRSTARIIKN